MPLAFALLLAGLVAPDAAGGLHWNAPPSCPTQAEVAALLDRQSQAGADDRVAGLRTTADATELPDGSWLVEIDIQGGGTRVQRVLQLDSCMAAAEAVALLYSLALTGGEAANDSSDRPALTQEPDEHSESEAVADPVPDPTEPAAASPSLSASEVAPTPAPTVSATNDEEPPAPQEPRTRGAIHLGGGAGIGSFGRGGGHLLGGVGVVWRWVRLGLRAEHAIFRRFRLEAEGVGVNVSATVVGLDLGVPVPVGPVELLPAVNLRAGALRAAGQGGAANQTRWVPWVLAGAGFTTVWMATRRWGVRGTAELEVPLLQHTFTFDQLVVHRSQPAGGLIYAAVEFRFPR